MLWYRITDFFKTRTGHLSLFALAVVSLFLFAAKYFKKKDESHELMASQFPRLNNAGGWADDETGSSNSSPQEVKSYQHEQPNQNFSPLRSLTSKPEPRLVVETPREVVEEPVIEEAFVPLTPLIKFQSRASATVDSRPERLRDEPKEELLPPTEPVLNLEAGALLYAELAGPLSSELNGGVVSAKLNRALIRGGKLLAPKGASLMGSLQQTAQNRLFLSADWQLQLADGKWVKLRGQAQESSLDPKTWQYTLNDGRAGLPGIPKSNGKQINPLWTKTLRTLALVDGRLAQDRVRTAVGDFVPGTARNIVLEGTSQIIEQDGIPFLSGQSNPSPLVIVEAGRPFYLSILP